MNIKLQINVILLLLSCLIYRQSAQAQCANNIGFENGNLGSWSTATDSMFINAPFSNYTTPGTNMAVMNYGGTDMYLGTITAPSTTAGSKCVKIGNSGVRAVADTVYREYVVDSLSDKLTIHSIGVVEYAHNYWTSSVVEAPGFGYEIYINGKKVDCLKGSFFCGNLDQPPVWQLGTFKDTNGVRLSTGWGHEVLNLACFVGDTVQIRLFTRDCTLRGHFAYAYFDVECGDTSKPYISQIMVNDIISADELNLYCTQNATLYLEPDNDICPIFMSNVQWSPPAYILGPSNLEEVVVDVPDSVWIYASAEFSNYCQTVTVFDSIYVKYYAADPRDNVPKIDKNFCECTSDTIDFTGLDLTSIQDANGNIVHTDPNTPFIINPCDNYNYSAYWKNTTSHVTTTGSAIGGNGWTSGGSGDGGITYDSMLWGSSIFFNVTISPSKSFYIGINDNNTSNNHDMTHSLYINGSTITSYYNGGSSSTAGTSYSGTLDIEFRILTNGRVRIYINGSQVRSYFSSQRAAAVTFGDYSANSNSPHVNSSYINGPLYNKKDFTKLVNPQPYEYRLNYTDRCGVNVTDTIVYTPGFNTTLTVPSIVQCGLDPVNFEITSNSLIDGISWSNVGTGVFTGPSGNGSLNTNQTSLDYAPNTPDYNTKPLAIVIATTSGTCTEYDTAYLTVNEIPVANAGPDISTTADTFTIGGGPSGFCATCPTTNYDWTQGSAMIDSTVSDPSVLRTQILHPMFVVTCTDPSTGCQSFDTTYIYTSLAKEDEHMHTQCINSETVEIKWLSIPDEVTASFNLEYSQDGGRSWYIHQTIRSNFNILSGPMEFSMLVKKKSNSNTLYRWTSMNHSGERLIVIPMHDLACFEQTVYTVYPNPFNNNIDLNIYSNSGNLSQYNIEIINQFGQLVYSKEVQLENKNINTLISIDGISELSSGIYYFIVKNKDKVLYKNSMIKTN